MIRTRDFIVFAIAFCFITSGIGVTLLSQTFSSTSQIASVGSIDFSSGSIKEIEGAISESEKEIPRNENIARLKAKIADGRGDISAGAPVFTSVDDIITDNVSITDQTELSRILIGKTTDGYSLYSDELWRFAGFSMFEQIGTALDGYPIFGARFDSSSLNNCGGIDEGMGYKYYLKSDYPSFSGCFGVN